MTSRYILSYLVSGVGIGYIINVDKIYFLKNILHLVENNSEKQQVIEKHIDYIPKKESITGYFSIKNISSLTSIFLIYYLYLKGYSFNDVMYVTKTTFYNSINILADHIKTIQNYISKVNLELQKKIGNVENNIEETKQMIEKQSLDVQQVLESQLNTENTIISLESKVEIANRGIQLLCTSVSNHIENSQELDTYVKKNIPVAKIIENNVSEKMQILDNWTRTNGIKFR